MRLLATNAVILVLVLASVPVWTGRRGRRGPPPSPKCPPPKCPRKTCPRPTCPPPRRPPPCPTRRCPPPHCPRKICPSQICPTLPPTNTRPPPTGPPPRYPRRTRPSSRASQFERPGYIEPLKRNEPYECPPLSASSLSGSISPSSPKMSTEVLIGFDERSISGKCLLPRSPLQNEFIAIETCGKATNLKSLCNLTVSAETSKNKYQKECVRPNDKLFPLQLGSKLQVTFHLSVPIECFENRFLCKLYRRPGTSVAVSDTVTVDTDTPDIDSTKVLVGSDENSISGQCTFNTIPQTDNIISLETLKPNSSKPEVLNTIKVPKTHDKAYFSESVPGPRKMVVPRVVGSTFQLTFHLSVSKANIKNKFRCKHTHMLRETVTEWATVNGF